MKFPFKLILALTLLGLVLAACTTAETPSLITAGQTTLVFIYTDG